MSGEKIEIGREELGLLVERAVDRVLERFLGPQQELLTVKDVCELMGVHRNTVFRWMRTEGLPFVQAKERAPVKFRRSALMEWIREREGRLTAAREGD